jgi:hypothetical protein
MGSLQRAQSTLCQVEKKEGTFHSTIQSRFKALKRRQPVSYHCQMAFFGLLGM